MNDASAKTSRQLAHQARFFITLPTAMGSPCRPKPHRGEHRMPLGQNAAGEDHAQPLQTGDTNAAHRRMVIALAHAGSACRFTGMHRAESLALRTLVLLQPTFIPGRNRRHALRFPLLERPLRFLRQPFCDPGALPDQLREQRAQAFGSRPGFVCPQEQPTQFCLHQTACSIPVAYNRQDRLGKGTHHPLVEDLFQPHQERG